jgi:large subunit ribosomal protein L24
MGRSLHVHKNDSVVIISGNSKGKQGKVLKVFPNAQTVIVESVNIVKRHTKPSQKNPQGGIVQKEGPIQVSNVMVLDPKTGKPTKIGYAHVTDPTSGKRKTMRISRKTGEMF